MNNELNNNGMNNQIGQPNNGVNNVPNQPYSGPVPIQPVNSLVPNENINGNISNGQIPAQPVNNQNNQAINGQSNIAPNPINDPISQPSPMPNNQNLNNQPVSIGEDKKNNKNIIKIVGIVAAVIAVLFIGIKLFGGSGGGTSTIGGTTTSTGGSNNKVIGNLYADIPSKFVKNAETDDRVIYAVLKHEEENGNMKTTSCILSIFKVSSQTAKSDINSGTYFDKQINGLNWKVVLIDNTGEDADYIKKYFLINEKGYEISYEISLDEKGYCQNEVEGFYNSLAIK